MSEGAISVYVFVRVYMRKRKRWERKLLYTDHLTSRRCFYSSFLIYLYRPALYSVVYVYMPQILGERYMSAMLHGIVPVSAYFCFFARLFISSSTDCSLLLSKALLVRVRMRYCSVQRNDAQKETERTLKKKEKKKRASVNFVSYEKKALEKQDERCPCFFYLSPQIPLFHFLFFFLFGKGEGGEGLGFAHSPS